MFEACELDGEAHAQSALSIQPEPDRVSVITQVREQSS
jgi:hypothetical protein